MAIATIQDMEPLQLRPTKRKEGITDAHRFEPAPLAPFDLQGEVDAVWLSETGAVAAADSEAAMLGIGCKHFVSLCFLDP